MSEIVPASLISQHYSNKRSPDAFTPPPKNQPSDSKIQEVVLSCIKLSPTGLFVSATSAEVILGQLGVVMGEILVMELEREKKIRKRRWNKRRPGEAS
jgi:hypothetical protein